MPASLIGAASLVRVLIRVPTVLLLIRLLAGAPEKVVRMALELGPLTPI